MIETVEMIPPLTVTGSEKRKIIGALSLSSKVAIKDNTVIIVKITVITTHNHQYDAIKTIFFSFRVQVKAWVASRQEAKRPGPLFAKRRSPRPDFP